MRLACVLIALLWGCDATVNGPSAAAQRPVSHGRPLQQQPSPAEVRAPRDSDEPTAAHPADPLSPFIGAARKMLEGRSGVIRIAHLGDSHTASEAFTGRMRERLQERLGEAGHGFVVPGWSDSRLHRGVVLGGGNGWQVERVRYVPTLNAGDRLFGIGAASVRTKHAGATLTVRATGARFELYYLDQPGGGSAELRLDGRKRTELSTRADRRGPAFHRLEVPDAAHLYEIVPRGDGEVRLFGVHVERPGPGIIYSSLGVMGARVTTPLEWEPTIFLRHLEAMDPRLVIMMYGTNDLVAEGFTAAGFARDLARLIGRVREALPGSACLVIAPPDGALRDDSGRLSSLSGLSELVAQARLSAAREGCGFWDTLARMGGPGSILEWRRQRPALAGRDHIHLTRAGYERLADQLADDLLRQIGELPQR